MYLVKDNWGVVSYVPEDEAKPRDFVPVANVKRFDPPKRPRGISLVGDVAKRHLILADYVRGVVAGPKPGIKKDKDGNMYVPPDPRPPCRAFLKLVDRSQGTDYVLSATTVKTPVGPEVHLFFTLDGDRVARFPTLVLPETDKLKRIMLESGPGVAMIPDWKPPSERKRGRGSSGIPARLIPGRL